MLNSQTVIKNSSKLGIARIFLAGVSILSILTVGGDFQKLQVFEKSTGLRNPPKHRIFVQESDRYNRLENDYKLIASIDNTKSIQKVLIALLGFSSAIGFYIIDEMLDRNKEAIGYKEFSEQQKIKLDIDTDIAVHSKIQESKIEVKLVQSIEEEFKNNPIYLQIRKQSMAAKEMIDDEADNDEADSDSIPFNPFTDIEEDVNKETVQDKYFTDAQARKIYSMIKDGIMIKAAIEKVAGYNSSNTNWNDIKSEIMERIRGIKNEG